MERETRFELATLALARRCSTTELLPLTKKIADPKEVGPNVPPFRTPRQTWLENRKLYSVCIIKVPQLSDNRTNRQKNGRGTTCIKKAFPLESSFHSPCL